VAALTKKLNKFDNFIHFSPLRLPMCRFFERIVLSVLLLSPAATVAQTNYSLAACLAQALQNNLSAQVDAFDRTNTQAAIQEVRSQLLPTVSASGQYQYYLTVPQQLIPAGLFGGQEGQYSSGAFSLPQTTSATVQLQQKLYDGQAMIGLKAARAVLIQNELQIRATREDLAYNVGATFYTLQVQEKQLELARATLGMAEQTLALRATLRQNGLSSQMELDRLTVATQNQRAQLETQQNNANKTRNLLRFLMNVPLDQPLVIEPIADIAIKAPLVLLPGVVAAETEAVNLEQRTDWRRASQQIAVTALERRSIKAGYQPTLSLSGSYGYSGYNDEFSPFRVINNQWFKASSVGLQLSVPIFDGNRRRAQLRQKDALLGKYDIQLAQTRQRIEREVADARADLASSHRTTEAQARTYALADRVYQDLQLQYRSGLTTLADVLTAETDLLNARSTYLSNLLNARRAELDLQKATGTLLP
jgi:outer membrane protein